LQKNGLVTDTLFVATKPLGFKLYLLAYFLKAIESLPLYMCEFRPFSVTAARIASPSPVRRAELQNQGSSRHYSRTTWQKISANQALEHRCFTSRLRTHYGDLRQSQVGVKARSCKNLMQRIYDC
jgi:hypothetical protein